MSSLILFEPNYLFLFILLEIADLFDNKSLFLSVEIILSVFSTDKEFFIFNFRFNEIHFYYLKLDFYHLHQFLNQN